MYRVIFATIVASFMFAGFCVAQESAEKSDSSVWRGDESIMLTPDKPKTFSFSINESTEISDKMKAYLDKVADFLKENPNYSVRVTGHSDNLRTIEENQKISEQRAQVVADYLTQKGIPLNGIFTRGAGAMFPIADNRTSEGRIKNRRVEIVLIKNNDDE